MRVFSLLLMLAFGGAVSACQTAAMPEPAVLNSTDQDSISKLKAVLAAEMGVAKIELGAVDLATQSTVSVLPPRLSGLETRSLAVPTQFDLFLKDGDCYIVRQGAEQLIAVPELECRKVNK